MSIQNFQLKKYLTAILFALFLSINVEAALTQVESNISQTALEKSNSFEREHIILIWPENLQVSWYQESGVRNPDHLADWLEKCYMLCIEWLKIDPNQHYNLNKLTSQKARLIFIHNGMRDYNFGGKLPRPVIGLRDFSGVGSEDWFGWLTHELSHEFFLCFPEIVSSPKNATWHEALCDYMRYWLLKESGLPAAANRWRQVLRHAERHDKYKGGADIILNYCDRAGYKSPAEFWAEVKGKNFTSCFGEAPWVNTNETAVPHGRYKIEFEGLIDGAGSFTFRGDKIYYEHFTWQYPKHIKINGRKWDDLNTPFDLGFSFDPVSARAIEGSGRNTLALIPHKDRLVIFIDDFDNSSSQYRISIMVEK